MQVLEACGWRLRHLDISDCTGLTDASLRAVGGRCGVLESFSLGNCPLLTTGAIQEVRIERLGLGLLALTTNPKKQYIYTARISSHGHVCIPPASAYITQRSQIECSIRGSSVTLRSASIGKNSMSAPCCDFSNP